MLKPTKEKRDTLASLLGMTDAIVFGSIIGFRFFLYLNIYGLCF